jgi:hypothetical protein
MQKEDSSVNWDGRNELTEHRRVELSISDVISCLLCPPTDNCSCLPDLSVGQTNNCSEMIFFGLCVDESQRP